MSYDPYYSGGWQSGETGSTPITPAALNHMETGIKQANSAAAKAAAPWNLLDNSDFSNPVNQRGLGIYEGGASQYTIDRWYTYLSVRLSEDGTIEGELRPEGYITLTNDSESVNRVFRQALPVNLIKDAKQVYTMAIGLADGTVIAGSRKVSDGSTALFYQDDQVRLQLYWEQSAFCNFGISLFPLVSIDIAWAALYVGEYAADTLPPYRPKGYAAELMECMRYYQIRSTDNVPALDMRPTMRLANPTITALDAGFAYSADL